MVKNIQLCVPNTVKKKVLIKTTVNTPNAYNEWSILISFCGFWDGIAAIIGLRSTSERPDATEKITVELHKKSRYKNRNNIYQFKRSVLKPRQYLGTDESAVQKSRCTGIKGVPPQPAQAFCPHLLHYGKRYSQAGRYPWPQQHKHHKNIYYHYRYRTPQKDRTSWIDSITAK